MNVVEIFQESARRNAANVAIIAGRAGREQTVSFEALDRRSRQIAALLLQEGLAPGEGVAVFVPMSAELYAIIAALLRVGMVPVFVERAAWRETIEQAADAVPLRGFIGTCLACAMRPFVPALRRIPKAFVVGEFFPGVVSLCAARTLAPCNHLEATALDAPAILTFTSGSSGPPKGVLRSHGLLAETHKILSNQLELAPGGLDVAVLPLVVFTNLASGVGSLIPDADLSRPGEIAAPRLARQIGAWSPEGIVASPALLERLADDALARGTRFDSLRRLFAGGAPVFPRLLDKLVKVAPRARVHALYGATEAEPMARLAADELSTEDRDTMRQGRGVLAGRPIGEVALRILHDRFGEPLGPWTPAELDGAIAPPGEAGEIVVSGRHVVGGYLGGRGDRELKIRVASQIWHRTGDAGWLDRYGRLWLLGSCKARVLDGGACRYPLAVEAALSDNPALLRSTLVRHRDRVLLVVEMREGRRDEALLAIARAVQWAAADEVVAIRRMPLDHRHNAKVDHPRLRRMLDARRWLKRVAVAGPLHAVQAAP